MLRLLLLTTLVLSGTSATNSDPSLTISFRKVSDLGSMVTKLRYNTSMGSTSKRTVQQLGYWSQGRTVCCTAQVRAVAIPENATSTVYASLDGVTLSRYNPFTNASTALAGNGDWRSFRSGYGISSGIGVMFQLAYNDTAATVLIATQFPPQQAVTTAGAGPSCIVEYSTKTGLVQQYACNCSANVTQFDTQGFPLVVDGSNGTATCYAICGLTIVQPNAPFDPRNIASTATSLLSEALYFAQFDGSIRRVVRTGTSTLVTTVYHAGRASNQPSGYFGLVAFPTTLMFASPKASLLGFFLANPTAATITLFALNASFGAVPLSVNASTFLVSSSGTSLSASGVRLDQRPALGSPQALALDPHTGDLWVGNRDDGTVFTMSWVLMERTTSKTSTLTVTQSQSQSTSFTEELSESGSGSLTQTKGVLSDITRSVVMVPATGAPTPATTVAPSTATPAVTAVVNTTSPTPAPNPVVSTTVAPTAVPTTLVTPSPTAPSTAAPLNVTSTMAPSTPVSTTATTSAGTPTQGLTTIVPATAVQNSPIPVTPSTPSPTVTSSSTASPSASTTSIVGTSTAVPSTYPSPPTRSSSQPQTSTPNTVTATSLSPSTITSSSTPTPPSATTVIPAPGLTSAAPTLAPSSLQPPPTNTHMETSAQPPTALPSATSSSQTVTSVAPITTVPTPLPPNSTFSNNSAAAGGSGDFLSSAEWGILSKCLLVALCLVLLVLLLCLLRRRPRCGVEYKKAAEDMELEEGLRFTDRFLPMSEEAALYASKRPELEELQELRSKAGNAPTLPVQTSVHIPSKRNPLMEGASRDSSISVGQSNANTASDQLSNSTVQCSDDDL